MLTSITIFSFYCISEAASDVPCTPTTSKCPEKHQLRDRKGGVYYGPIPNKKRKKTPRASRKKHVQINAYTEDLYDYTVRDFDYTKTGVLLDKIKCPTPYHVFCQFFTDVVIDRMVEATNAYAERVVLAKQRNRQKSETKRRKIYAWKRVDRVEMKAFLGLMMLMGVVQRKNYKDHWEKNSIIRTKIFEETMTFSRWISIKNMLQVTEKGRDRIDDFAAMLVHNWQAAYHPSRELSLDESLMKFKGRTKMKQCQKLKPAKEGLMALLVSEAKTGYIFNWDLYRGKAMSWKVKDYNTKTALRLLKPVANLGHHVYMDSAYTSGSLLHKMATELGTGGCGTIRKDRKGVPEKIKNITHDNMFVKSQDAELGVRYLSWPKSHKKAKSLGTKMTKKTSKRAGWFGKDPAVVRICTNVHNINKIDKNTGRPAALEQYNFYMGGVDLSNQRMVYFLHGHKTVKWWRKVFFNLLEISYVNTHIIYRSLMQDVGRKVDVGKFRQDIIKGLIVENRARRGFTPESLDQDEAYVAKPRQRKTSQRLVPHAPSTIENTRTTNTNNEDPVKLYDTVESATQDKDKVGTCKTAEEVPSGERDGMTQLVVIAHFPGRNTNRTTNGKVSLPRCVVCSTKSNRKRKQTSYVCVTCNNLPMCADKCFKAYHTALYDL